MFSRKSNEKAEILRSEGNKFYRERRFFKALLLYNESLCYAEPTSENVGLAFANRSAVYFEMKFYEKCLKNIELAKRHQYPESSCEIINKRFDKCEDSLRGQKPINDPKSDVWSFFKLSYPPNKKLPYIAECLEMKTSKKYGRHVITNQDLKVGDIIVIEKPFCR